MRKVFETDVAIVPGMYLEDGAWRDNDKEITGVTICPDEPYLMLGLADQPENLPNEEACAKREAQFRACGWRSASEWQET